MYQASSAEKSWLGHSFHVDHNESLFRAYDVKDISVSLLDDLHTRIRFHAEIQHPNIEPLLWLDEKTIGTPYLAGVSIEQLIYQGVRLNREVLEYILVRINELFSFVHSQGWIHGDVHPGLIYLTQDGEIVIGGFGRRPENKAATYTGHHRYLSPEPMESIYSDLYGIGVIILELALGENILLGDLLEDLHCVRVQDYLNRMKEDHPLCAAFISIALGFSAEDRIEAPKELLSLLGGDPPDQWLEYCQSLLKNTEPYRPDVTDPMDMVFHTEEIFDNAFPTSDEITCHELTEELVDDISVDDDVKEETTRSAESKTMVILVVIIVILLFILVYMQSP